MSNSVTGQIINFLAANPCQRDKIGNTATLIANAVEEAVRLATPIRTYSNLPVRVHLADSVLKDAPAVLPVASL